MLGAAPMLWVTGRLHFLELADELSIDRAGRKTKENQKCA